MAMDVKEYQRQYRKANKERLSAYNAEWRVRNAEKQKEIRRAKYEQRRDDVLAKQEEDRKANPGKYAEQKATRRAENLEKIRSQEKASKARNAEAVRQRMAAYRRKARANNPLVAIKDRLRARIGISFRLGGYTRKSSLVDVLGCDYQSLKRHIEESFLPGMSWDNRGEWHIDHRMPLATARCEDDLLKLSHYSNLRAMWAQDNLRKGAKVEG